jgi:hypothetical protein
MSTNIGTAVLAIGLAMLTRGMLRRENKKLAAPEVEVIVLQAPDQTISPSDEVKSVPVATHRYIA